MLIENELNLNAIEYVIIIIYKIIATGKNRLWQDFYDPVSQNDGQGKSVAQALNTTGF